MTNEWRIPVLTYHGLHVPGWSYQENDHVALEQDLEILAGLGFKIIPLTYLVRLLKNPERLRPAGPNLAALSFDDGTDLDYLDFSHPEFGHLKSFRRILAEFDGLGLDGRIPHATCFVIASPDARKQLDETCIAGRDQWRDTWWSAAAMDGNLGIGNHSWDHVHPSLDQLVVDSSCKGRFDRIADFAAADAEILDAQAYISDRTGGCAQPLFAYPYGQAGDFLVSEYFPSRQQWFEAAFTTAGRHVVPSDSRWLVPRYVCGEHWNSPEQLRAILRD